MPRRRPIRILLWCLLGVVVAVIVAALSLLTVPPPLEAYLQGRVIEALREHYHRDVQLQNLKVTLVPEFEASADNFVLPNLEPSLPPFITAKHFIVRGALPELLRKPVHLGWLKFDGLEIHVPPKGSKPAGGSGNSGEPAKKIRLADFEIAKVFADGTMLYVHRKDPTADPMLFNIRKLSLRSAGIGQPMKFKAELTNALPPGLVDSTGYFGPWNFDEPSETKLGGHYVFQHADLSVFNGISGILSSTGDYTGALNNIIVDGTTDTPDFQLDRGATEVHLTTKFHAVVNGTNGNTYLQPVDAAFLNSHVICNGEVAGKPGVKGKTISLDVSVQNSQLQDLLQLASKSDQPAITGNIDFNGHVTVPPGNEVVLKKLLMNGNFQVEHARFTDQQIRNKIIELSRRGQGKPKDDSIQEAPAQFAGDFNFRNTVLTFRRLQFSVPGVAAQTKGSYGIASGKIDFVGDVRLDAKISDVVGGKEKWVLIPFDPLFMKHSAGTYLPVNISGTRNHPDINLDWKKIF